MPDKDLIPNLFRSEFTKMVSILCTQYGFSNLQVVEDIVSDTFLKATETWGLKGIPDNPKAWLHRVAQNRAIDLLRREKIFRTKIAPIHHKEPSDPEHFGFDGSIEDIQDAELQMLFAVCHPIISQEAQVTLALRILCGFGIGEIASAFLTTKDTINKRLYRAKSKLKTAEVSLEFPNSSDQNQRLDQVLSILYLLFNEGYYSQHPDRAIRKELSYEAMRLCYELIKSVRYNVAEVQALMALFCFQSSRFDARIDNAGNSVLYYDQNPELWNQELIAQGVHYLKKATLGKAEGRYQLEASIAFFHTQPHDTDEKWRSILTVYNKLLQLHYSPMIALNRTYALSRVYGKEKAIEETKKIKLHGNIQYHLLLGELYKDLFPKKRISELTLAHSLCTTQRERDHIDLLLTV